MLGTEVPTSPRTLFPDGSEGVVDILENQPDLYGGPFPVFLSGREQLLEDPLVPLKENMAPLIQVTHRIDVYPPHEVLATESELVAVDGNEKNAELTNDEEGILKRRLAGRLLGNDFSKLNGFSMYRGRSIPGFPQMSLPLDKGMEYLTICRRGLIDYFDNEGGEARFGNGDVLWLASSKDCPETNTLSWSELFPALNTDDVNTVEVITIGLSSTAFRSKKGPDDGMDCHKKCVIWSEEQSTMVTPSSKCMIHKHDNHRLLGATSEQMQQCGAPVLKGKSWCGCSQATVLTGSIEIQMIIADSQSKESQRLSSPLPRWSNYAKNSDFAIAHIVLAPGFKALFPAVYCAESVRYVCLLKGKSLDVKIYNVNAIETLSEAPCIVRVRADSWVKLIGGDEVVEILLIQLPASGGVDDDNIKLIKETMKKNLEKREKQSPPEGTLKGEWLYEEGPPETVHHADVGRFLKVNKEEDRQEPPPFGAKRRSSSKTIFGEVAPKST